MACRRPGAIPQWMPYYREHRGTKVNAHPVWPRLRIRDLAVGFVCGTKNRDRTTVSRIPRGG